MANLEDVDDDAVTERDPTTTQVVQSILLDARQLVRVEIALAKDELKREAADARRSVVTLGVSFLLLSCAATLLLLSLAIAIGEGALPIVVEGAGLLVAAAACAMMGVKRWPPALLPKAEQRLETDIDHLKEHLS